MANKDVTRAQERLRRDVTTPTNAPSGLCYLTIINSYINFRSDTKRLDGKLLRFSLNSFFLLSLIAVSGKTGISLSSLSLLYTNTYSGGSYRTVCSLVAKMVKYGYVVKVGDKCMVTLYAEKIFKKSVGASELRKINNEVKALL